MSDGRVTIMCGNCNAAGTPTPAVEINFYGRVGKYAVSGQARTCSSHVAGLRNAALGKYEWDYYLPLINPGTCSESDVLAVECAMDAIARLLRRDEADVARLRAAAEAVKGKYYVPCWKGPPDRSCRIGGYRCERCNGTGLVLRRRSDGTAVIDELDAGSVAA